MYKYKALALKIHKEKSRKISFYVSANDYTEAENIAKNKCKKMSNNNVEWIFATIDVMSKRRV